MVAIENSKTIKVQQYDYYKRLKIAAASTVYIGVTGSSVCEIDDAEEFKDVEAGLIYGLKVPGNDIGVGNYSGKRIPRIIFFEDIFNKVSLLEAKATITIPYSQYLYS